MAKKNTVKKEVKEVAEAVTEPIEEVKEVAEAKPYRTKDAKVLGFEKRNYFCGGKRVLIIAGTSYTESVYNSFSSEAKAAFFE